jgi:hypothetical protein
LVGEGEVLVISMPGKIKGPGTLFRLAFWEITSETPFRLSSSWEIHSGTEF